MVETVGKSRGRADHFVHPRPKSGAFCEQTSVLGKPVQKEETAVFACVQRCKLDVDGRVEVLTLDDPWTVAGHQQGASRQAQLVDLTGRKQVCEQSGPAFADDSSLDLS